MHPFFYPTTTMIIDDEPILLESLNSSLSENFLCKCFNNTQAALDYANALNNNTLNIENFFSPPTDKLEISSHIQGDIFIKLKAAYWFHIMHKNIRFQELSIAVVDYRMPFMNGIELCRKLKGLPMKKIMLTGLASKELAVEAFNEKIIDSFILKQEHDLINRLTKDIEDLKHQYFIDKTKTVKFAFSQSDTQFINDTVFEKTFEQILQDHKIIEYYLNASPPSVLVIPANGTPSIMLVYNSECMRANYEIAQEYGAPQELLEVLSQLKHITFFPTASGYYHKKFANDWKKYLYNVKPIQGKQTWYLSELIPADFVKEYLADFTSYEEYNENNQMVNEDFLASIR